MATRNMCAKFFLPDRPETGRCSSPDRRTVIAGLASVAAWAPSAAAISKEAGHGAASPRQAPGFPDWSDEKWADLSATEWRARLPKKAYSVLRKEATERPFSSDLNGEKREGWYACAGCGLILFSSRHKYDSGTGWPSFWTAIDGRCATKADFKLLYRRTEYHCVRCEGHQGHLFRDGPRPTGERWCNNGTALVFIESTRIG